MDVVSYTKQNGPSEALWYTHNIFVVMQNSQIEGLDSFITNPVAT